MTMTHTDLPQLNGQLFVTDSGLETELIFHDGLDLPCFASFPLLDDDAGRERLRRYAQNFVDVARRHGVGAMLETATWRANPDWADQLGYDSEALARMNRRSVVELTLSVTRTPISWPRWSAGPSARVATAMPRPHA